jgi:hypothetical protein
LNINIPGAAASLCEGLEETIENLFGRVREIATPERDRFSPTIRALGSPVS